MYDLFVAKVLKSNLCIILFASIFVLNLKAQISDSVNNFQTHIPSLYTPNTSYAVGNIQYHQEVTSYGGVSINIPIEISQTPNLFFPSLSLNYNSLSGKDLLGYGWDLNYGSLISKGNQTYYYDGCSKAYGISDISSAFYLDGVRLIRIDSCATYIEYKCETGYNKVYAYLTNGNITHFEVRLPNGIKNTYSVSDGINFYLVNSVDVLGNKIIYTYNQTYKPFLPSTIEYGTSGEAVITFDYIEQTENYPVTYHGGTLFQKKLLLNQVTSTINDSLYRRYGMTYISSKGNKLLDNISCNIGDGNNNSINPLRFYYDDTDINCILEEENYSFPYDYIVVNPAYQITKKGKFEYGTEMDAFLHLTKKISYKKDGSKIVNEYTLDSLTDYNICITSLPVTGTTVYSSNSQVYADVGFIDCMCMDVDDAPGDEVVVITNIVENGLERLRFRTYKTAIKTSPKEYLSVSSKYCYDFLLNTAITATNGERFVTPKDFFQGDFNGDGHVEILAVSSDNTLGYGNVGKCYVFDIKNSKILYEGTPFSYKMDFPTNDDEVIDVYRKSDKLYIIDFDGDSKSDICHINEKGMHIYTFETQNDTLIKCKHVSTVTAITNDIFNNNNDRQLLIGEFNGDGKTDFILSSAKNASASEKIKWTKYLSKGDGIWDSSYYSNLFEYDNEAQYFLQDMNNDGISDVIRNCLRDEKTYIGVWILAHPTQTESSDNNFYEREYSGGLYFIPSDIQNRNFSNHILATRYSTVTRYYLANNKYDSRLLTGMVSSNGLIHKYSYRRLSDRDDDTFYVKGEDAKFPYFNYKGPLNVCNRSIALLDNDTLNDIHYSYFNAVCHKQGLGFLGFEKFESNDVIRNEFNEIHFVDTCHFRVPIYASSVRESIEYCYDINITSDKTAKIELKEALRYDRMHNSEDTLRYTYDSYGNITSEQHRYCYDHSEYPENSTCWYKTITSYRNLINDSTYILGLPLISTVTASNGGLNKDVKRTIYTYNLYGQPLTKTNANMPSSYASDVSRAAPPVSDENVISKETYSYDENHRLVKKSLKKYTSSASLDETYTYYENGSLKTKTDAMGLTERFVYDERGRLTEYYDHRNNVTKHTYDGWNRKIKSTHPETPQFPETIKYSYVGTSDNVPGALTKITIKGKYEDVEYYDALGRKIKTKEERFDGNPLYIDYQYDVYGRVIKESYPYKTGETIQCKNYTYDKYDRLQRTEYASGRIEESIYDCYFEERTSDSIVTIIDYNPFGEILRIDNYDLETWQNTGSVYYDYHSKGQVYQIALATNSSLYFSYDQYGRCTSVNDPSTGTKTYTYNSSGEITSIKESNGLETNYTYDRYGRKLTESSMYSGDKSYTYNNYGDLKQETGGNRIRTYSYDTYGRLIHDAETYTDGTKISRSYRYDTTSGNLTAIIDSINGQEAVSKNYIYDTADKFLKQIKIGNTIIWQRTRENSSGDITEEITGPLKRIYTYDIDGNPVSIKTTKKENSTSDSIILQHFTYNISTATRNLMSRTDGTRNLIESFTYDNVGRLTTFGSNEVEYDYSGNITSMTGVGTYGYQSLNPYAVTSITLSGERIPGNVQEIIYHAQGRVATIQEGNHTATFDYNGVGDRTRLAIKEGNTVILDRTYSQSGIYEKDITPVGIEERLYLDGDAYTAKSVMTRHNGGEWEIRYICRDQLGSITHVTDKNGNLLQELSYDAWGNLRNPSTHELYTQENQPSPLLGRGYTGHEHLPLFGLINMNARMYDPVTARFLSPDPYVQEKMNMQNYNRYSYCLNNPFKYVDKSGELFSFVRELLVNTFIRPWNEGINAWTDSDNWHATKNTFKLTNGLFAGNFKQIISRFTLELPQTLLGYTFSKACNNLGLVKNVEHFRGATATTLYSKNIGLGGAITLGSFIIGGNELKAEVGNELFMHEYGHYLQSQNSGPFYLLNYGIPSFIPYKEQKKKSVEQDANARAIRFFDKEVNSKFKWNFIGYPVGNYRSKDDVKEKYDYDYWYETLIPF